MSRTGWIITAIVVLLVGMLAIWALQFIGSGPA